MKLTANQYAKALYQSTQDKSEKEVSEVVSNLIAVLKKNNQLKLIANVIAKFSETWNKEEGIVEAEVTTRFEIQKSEIKKIEEFIRDKYQAKEVILNNKIDEKIKGGIIIKVGDELLDASVEKRLRDLKSSLEK